MFVKLVKKEKKIKILTFENDVVLLDSQDIPRRIDPKELSKLVKQRHQETMNAWMVDYAELAKIRTAKDV